MKASGALPRLKAVLYGKAGSKQMQANIIAHRGACLDPLMCKDLKSTHDNSTADRASNKVSLVSHNVLKQLIA